jgi:phosphoenolpyruvate carboxykinase (GTP)
VFVGARAGSEKTAAAAGQVGKLRRDPMAMIPFCGYNMGDYFQHWLNLGARMAHPPKIFAVNWFRVDEDGKFIWPGFGDNIRALKWIVDRVDNRVGARETPIGLVPNLEDLNLEGLDIPADKVEKLFEVNPGEWDKELNEVKGFLEQFGDRLPREIWDEYKALASRIDKQS